MIDKLNGVQFTGKAAKNLPAQKPEKENKQEQPKQVVVVSKDGAKALRNYAMGIEFWRYWALLRLPRH